MNEPKLGEWITIDHKLRRTHSQNYAQWVPQMFREPVKAMFIGKRTLGNGEIRYSYEDGVEFRRKEAITAWLVVINTRNKPFYVMPGEPHE